MTVKARHRSTTPQSVRDYNDEELPYKEKAKLKYAHHKTTLSQKQVRFAAAAALLLTILLILRSFVQTNDGPPRDLVVVGKRTYYQHVPLEFRRRFYIDDDNPFRRTVIRAFRNRGWRKANEPEEAQFVYDKYAWDERFSQLLPWQRYSHFP